MSTGSMSHSNAAMDVSSLSMFDNGPEGLSSNLPADMSGLNNDASMTGMLDSGANIMDSLDIDMLPMNLDVNLDENGDPQTFTSITPPSGHPRQQSDDANDPNGMSDNNTSGVGAGPLPTGFGAHASSGSGSTLTEFTKRRNWSQRVLEELKDFLHILTPDGRILYVSPSSGSLTGYNSEDLVGKFIGEFIHPDDSGIFVREFNESIATGNPLRFFYRFRKSDNTYTIFESHGHPHLTSEAANYGGSNSMNFCRGFFMMSRPYPTKNAALLDSFLEHKIENERLMKRIADLKREEQEDLENQQRHFMKKQEGHSSVTQSDVPATESETQGTSMASGRSGDYKSMPPPAKPGTANTALTRQNLDEANATAQPDSINDKMARYEGSTHVETIEMLTGLRYQDGERSQGISTGDASPALIRGDAGIAIPVDKDTRASADKKKKLKVADEYVCTDCGTLDSPEWRKGPSGPKTLCNACGLRWAKKEKKRNTNTTPTSNPNSNNSATGTSLPTNNLNSNGTHMLPSNSGGTPQLPMQVSTSSS